MSRNKRNDVEKNLVKRCKSVKRAMDTKVLWAIANWP